MVGILYLNWYIKNGNFDKSSSEWWYLSALLIAMLGLLIRTMVVGYSADNTSGRNTHGQVADSLNTKGLYSIVRHPLYLGNYLMWVSFAFITQSWMFIISFSLAFWLYYERIMMAEEEFLRGKFGEHFINWSKNRPAFLPRISGYQHPQVRFDIKKVLRQEKNGVLALGILFFFFKSLENYIILDFIDIHHWTFYFFVVSTLFYLFFKWAKRKPWMQT